jgi:hypothetical protein
MALAPLWGPATVSSLVLSLVERHSTAVLLKHCPTTHLEAFTPTAVQPRKDTVSTRAIAPSGDQITGRDMSLRALHPTIQPSAFTALAELASMPEYVPRSTTLKTVSGRVQVRWCRHSRR